MVALYDANLYYWNELDQRRHRTKREENTLNETTVDSWYYFFKSGVRSKILCLYLRSPE